MPKKRSKKYIAQRKRVKKASEAWFKAQKKCRIADKLSMKLRQKYVEEGRKLDNM